MKKKTLLRLVMVCLLLGCGVSGIKAQITIDKMANELEKRDECGYQFSDQAGS